jgi:hypothetical protein
MKVLMLVITARVSAVIDPMHPASRVMPGPMKPQRVAYLTPNPKAAALTLAQESMGTPAQVEITGELLEIDIDDLSIKKVPLPEVEFKGSSNANIQN